MAGRAGAWSSRAPSRAAGKDLSRALATEFQTPQPEAHHWKEQHGALASAAAAQGPDGERAAAAFVRGLQPVLRELRPTFKAFTARTRQQVGSVLLCGGTARMPGLAEQLSKDLGMPVRVLALPQEASAAVPASEQPAATQAYALALRGQASGAKAPRFNLRRGEFAFKGDYDYLKDKLGLLASFAATLLLLLIASGVVRNSVLARREAQVDAVLCDVTQRILGSCEKNYDIALNLPQGRGEPGRRAAEDVGRQPPGGDDAAGAGGRAGDVRPHRHRPRAHQRARRDGQLQADRHHRHRAQGPPLLQGSEGGQGGEDAGRTAR